MIADVAQRGTRCARPIRAGSAPSSCPAGSARAAWVRGGGVDVFVARAGIMAVTLPDALPAKGAIVLGMDVVSVRDRPPFAVSFANVDIRQL